MRVIILVLESNNMTSFPFISSSRRKLGAKDQNFSQIESPD